MGGRTLATCRSVREILAEQGVECVIDDEWFKDREFKNEQFERNMKNVLKIEKKNAVKEFAEKLKRVFHDDYVTPSGYADERLVFECVDDLLKEVFGNDEE